MWRYDNRVDSIETDGAPSSGTMPRANIANGHPSQARRHSKAQRNRKMETKRENVIKKLAERFATLSAYITTVNRSGYTDINKSAERLFMNILNVAYGLRLRDMNSIQDNYPAIDLGDYSDRVCFQVTSEATTAKVKHTLEKFNEKGLDRDFDEIRFLIISDKRAPAVPRSEVKVSILTLDDVHHKIAKLEDVDLFYLDRYLDANLRTRLETQESILPPSILPSYSFVNPKRFMKFLRFDKDSDLVVQATSDLKAFSQVISSLTDHQRQYLYYIVARGSFKKNYMGYEQDVVIMPTSELIHHFGDYGRQLYDVLAFKGLTQINDGYDPFMDERPLQVVELYSKGSVDELNLFAELKRFCATVPNGLERIFLNADFSCLGD